MKGIINRGIQEMVETRFGAEAWERVRSLAGWYEPIFDLNSDYSDELTISLIEAVSETFGLTIGAVMRECGRFMVPNTLRRNCAEWFELAGSSPRELLLNMDRVHEQVTRSVPNAVPPRFKYEEMPDGRLLIRYKSKRRLCALLQGLILGVGDHFEQELVVREVECMNRGSQYCVMEVTFP